MRMAILTKKVQSIFPLLLIFNSMAIFFHNPAHALPLVFAGLEGGSPIPRVVDGESAAAVAASSLEADEDPHSEVDPLQMSNHDGETGGSGGGAAKNPTIINTTPDTTTTTATTSTATSTTTMAMGLSSTGIPAVKKIPSPPPFPHPKSSSSSSSSTSTSITVAEPNAELSQDEVGSNDSNSSHTAGTTKQTGAGHQHHDAGMSENGGEEEGGHETEGDRGDEGTNSHNGEQQENGDEGEEEQSKDENSTGQRQTNHLLREFFRAPSRENFRTASYGLQLLEKEAEVAWKSRLHELAYVRQLLAMQQEMIAAGYINDGDGKLYDPDVKGFAERYLKKEKQPEAMVVNGATNHHHHHHSGVPERELMGSGHQPQVERHNHHHHHATSDNQSDTEQQQEQVRKIDAAGGITGPIVDTHFPI